MLKHKSFHSLMPAYFLLLLGIIAAALFADKTIATYSENSKINQERIVVIDAGHGGEDGGATSCSGVLESEINLEIALRLNDIFRLLGVKTYMVRTSNVSVYLNGNTISQRKISDLKERVKLVNELDNAVMISIHQNYFSDSRFCGPQVFYADSENSAQLALCVQNALNQYTGPGNNRKAKKTDTIYLLSRCNKTAILVECGFLSNPGEEALLRNTSYQQKLCGILACAYSQFYNISIHSA